MQQKRLVFFKETNDISFGVRREGGRIPLTLYCSAIFSLEDTILKMFAEAWWHTRGSDIRPCALYKRDGVLFHVSFIVSSLLWVQWDIIPNTCGQQFKHVCLKMQDSGKKVANITLNPLYLTNKVLWVPDRVQNLFPIRKVFNSILFSKASIFNF